MDELKKEIESLLFKYPEIKDLGRRIELRELETISNEVSTRIPNWYKKIVTSYPLYEARIGIPHNFGQPELLEKSGDELPLLEISFRSFVEIESDVKSFYPGYELIRKSYISIAEERNGEGEGIYIDAENENPPLLLISHEDGESAQELIRNGTKISESLIDFFRQGKVMNHHKRVGEEVRSNLMPIIEELLHELHGKKNHAENIQEFEDFLMTCEKMLNEQQVIALLIQIESGLYDLSFKLDAEFYEKLERCYQIGGLHLGELTFLKELIH